MIPKFQRRYSWGIENAHSLIRDIAEVATQPLPKDHWTGVVIYRELNRPEQKCLGGRSNINHTCREVIDGQQRLATIRLWITALLDHARFSGEQIGYQLTPFYPQSPNDKEFEAIDNRVDVSKRVDKISTVYTYFRYILWLGEHALLHPDAIRMPDGRVAGDTVQERWARWVEQRNASKFAALSLEEGTFLSGSVDTAKLLEMTVVHFSFVGLLIQDEDPESVFSALNGNRTELSQFDHLRNFIFSSVSGSRRDALFDEFWEPSELLFESVKLRRGTSRDYLKSVFLYDYLISVGEGGHGSFNASRSFGTFLRFQRSSRFKNSGASNLESWVSNVMPREIACWIVQRQKFFDVSLPSGAELRLTSKARRAMHRIRLVSDGPPAPLVLWILRRSLLPEDDPRLFSPSEVERALIRLEGYLFKSLLSGNSLTNLRAGVIGSLGKIDENCVSQPSSPGVEYLLREIDKWTDVRWSSLRHDLEQSHANDPLKGIYGSLGSRGALALLDAIDEEYSGPSSTGFFLKEWAYGDDPWWVEHIFPQKSKQWSKDLKGWNEVESEMQMRLHSLGNLTALPEGVNRAVTNKRLEEKVAFVLEDNTAAATKLQKWLDNDQWTSQLIDDRTHHFIGKISSRWPDPV